MLVAPPAEVLRGGSKRAGRGAGRPHTLRQISNNRPDHETGHFAGPPMSCDKIETSMRPLTAIMVNGALLLAFLQAPSLHVHSQEATQRHAGAFLHTHFAHRVAPLSNRAEWRDLDPDDDAQFLIWVSIAPSDGLPAPVILVASNVIRPPIGSQWQMTILRLCAHDPPALNATTPRAPPV